MNFARREVIALSAGALALPGAAAAQSSDSLWPPAERFALWPRAAPGAPPVLPRWSPEITNEAEGYHNLLARGTAVPEIGVFRAGRPDGRAVLIAPGGGYAIVSLRGEGTDVARVLTRMGITAFVLNYRLPAEGWRDRANVPLQDAQRAMRLIRASAPRWRIDPARLGVIGFSAGGHLAGSLVTQADTPVYPPVDGADRQSARPAFGGLLYAVSNMDLGRSHGGSRANLLGPTPDPTMIRRYDVDRRIGPGTPPLFVMHAEDDTVVPFANGIDLFAAARAAGIRSEGHFFERGGHGFGVRLPSSMPASLWPELFDRWTRGLFEPIR